MLVTLEAVADDGPHQATEVLQHAVALGVAGPVVETLEVVDVDVDEAERLPRAAAPSGRPGGIPPRWGRRRLCGSRGRSGSESARVSSARWSLRTLRTRTRRFSPTTTSVTHSRGARGRAPVSTSSVSNRDGDAQVQPGEVQALAADDRRVRTAAGRQRFSASSAAAARLIPSIAGDGHHGDDVRDHDAAAVGHRAGFAHGRGRYRDVVGRSGRQ